MAWEWRVEAMQARLSQPDFILWSLIRHCMFEQPNDKVKAILSDINFELIVVLTFLFWLLIKNTKLGKGTGLQGDLILIQRDTL